MTTKIQNENSRHHHFRQWVQGDGWGNAEGAAFGIAYAEHGSLLRAKRLCFDQATDVVWFETDLLRKECAEAVGVAPGPTALFGPDGLAPIVTEPEGPLLRAVGGPYRDLPVYFHRSGLRADFDETKTFRRQDAGILLPQVAARSLSEFIKPRLKPYWLSAVNTRYTIARAAKRLLAQPVSPPAAMILTAPRQASYALVVPGDNNRLDDTFFTELAKRKGYRFASEFESRLRAGASQQELMLLLLRE